MGRQAVPKAKLGLAEEVVDESHVGVSSPQSFMNTVRVSNGPLIDGEAGRAADNEGVVDKNIAFVPAGGGEGVFGRFSGVARQKTGSRAVGLSSYSRILASRRGGRLFLCKRRTPRGGELGGKKVRNSDFIEPD